MQILSHRRLKPWPENRIPEAPKHLIIFHTMTEEKEPPRMQRLQVMLKNVYVSRTEKCAMCRLPLLQGDQHIQICVVGNCDHRAFRHILLPETAERTLKAIRAINPFGEFLFMDKQGRRIRANRFNHWLHRACKKVGIPERSTHKIRKTYASILLSNKVDERLVINQMGHTDIATTRGSYYFNRNSEDKNKGIISNAINF